MVDTTHIMHSDGIPERGMFWKWFGCSVLYGSDKNSHEREEAAPKKVAWLKFSGVGEGGGVDRNAPQGQALARNLWPVRAAILASAVWLRG